MFARRGAIAGVVFTLVAGLAFAASPEAPVPGPGVTDPDKYQLLLENERVRVFRYHDEPKAKTRLHHHDAFVLYALGPFKRRLTFANGKSQEREFKTGDVISMEAQNHIGENIGTTPTEALIVEMKTAGPTAPADAGWLPSK